MPSADPTSISPRMPAQKNLTPQEVEHKPFTTTRRGYDEHEVRAFLHAVAAQLYRLEMELADHRLRVLETAGRLNVAESLREDALARAAAAEAGRRHVEVLLAHLGAERTGARERQLVEQVEARRPPDEPSRPADDRPGAAGDLARPEAAGIEGAAGALDSESDTYTQTEEQIRALEQAAAATVETTKAQVQRIARSALQLAQLWGIAGDDLGHDVVRSVPPEPAVVTPEPAAPPPGWTSAESGQEPKPFVDLRPDTPAPPDAGYEAGSVTVRPVKFTTAQARAAAAALHASARDDLHLAGFWIHEAEQDVSADATLTSRTILDEANQLLTMAAELGHPAPELVEQYVELRIRARRLQE